MAAALLALTVLTNPLRLGAVQLDSFDRYRQFVGASLENRIPTIKFTFDDPFYDDATYVISKDSSLFLLRQSSHNIVTITYHDQKYAEKLDENGAVSWDNGNHLKDLITVEALITGRISLSAPTSQSLGHARVSVPGGWPVSLSIGGDGKLLGAVIHGSEDEKFYPMAYTAVGGVNVVSNWVFGKRHFRAVAVSVADAPITPPHRTGLRWLWRSRSRRWTEPFVPFGNRPMVPIYVNGVTTRCILDTGTAGIFLPPSLAVTARVEQGTRAVVDRQTGPSVASYGRADVRIGPAELFSAVVVIGPRTPGAYAVCGYDFLSSFVVTVAERKITIVTRGDDVPRCMNHCIRVDTWSRTAMARVQVGSLAISRATLDTGLDGSLLLADYLRPLHDMASGDCEEHPSVGEPLTIGSVAVGRAAACYAPLDPQHPAVVGSAVLLRHSLTIDLGDGEVWINP